MTDTLQFKGGGTTTTLTVHDGGCTGTSFVTKSRSFPDLEDTVLHAELVKLLELPDSYTQYGKPAVMWSVTVTMVHDASGL